MGLIVRMVLMMTVMMCLVGSLHYYVGRHLINGAGLVGSSARLAWALLALVLISIPLSILSDRLFPSSVSDPLHWMTHVWLGAFVVLLTATVLTDVVWLVLRLSGYSLSSQSQAVAIAVISLPALIWGFATARGLAHIERLEIPIRGLDPSFDGFRIAQVSDIHIGPTLKADFLVRMVGQVNALEPDVVAITGDLVDGPVEKLREEMDALSFLRAPDGSYFVTGNHEYYHGGPAWEEEVRSHGVTVLHNEHRVLKRANGRLVLGGVTDLQGRDFGPEHVASPEQAFRGAPEGVPRILLAHQPRAAFAAAAHNVDLQLSGHTHGGQIFPFMALVRLQQPVVSGLRRVGGVLVYTNRGTGYWGPPIRLGPRPEITLLTLRAA